MSSRTDAIAEAKGEPKAEPKPEPKPGRRVDQPDPKSEQPTPLQLGGFLPHRLNVLSSLVSQALTRVYAAHGIGIPEWRVLVSLGQFGVMTGKAIGARTHMHKTKVSRAVAELERRKFLTRRVNRADLREAFLSLTPAGRAVYDELAPRALEFTQRLSEVVAPADRAAFDRAMTALTERSAKLVEEMELERGPADDRIEP